jgi:arylsulfatase A-like enzyme
VRFVELSCLAYNIGGGNGANPWDQHSEVKKGHETMARQVDQPIAALLADLDERGLLDDTLVVWAGEFGRTPFSQGSNGRDHNPSGFTVWFAGAGVKRAFHYGATDEFGYKAVENVATIYDLHATILHLIGLDHTRLSFYNNGIERRLTDVHGHVIQPVLA